MMIKKFIQKIIGKINRYRLFINPRIYRPSSEPFISGDSFRKISDHVFDETQTVNPSKVLKNDLVFVKNDLLKYYFHNYHSKIKNPYILISHNSDENIDNSYIKLIDDNIIHWFSQNLKIKNSDRISSLPIGLENMRYRKNGIVKQFSETKNVIEKKFGIMSSFNENTNFNEREYLRKIIDNHNDIDHSNFNSTRDYLEALNKSKFNICPSGNGLDTHRIWESLIFKTVPIVTRNLMIENFFDMGIPMIVLDEWEELKSLSLNEIGKLNEANNEKSFFKYTNFDHWINLIYSKKI